MNLPGIVPEEGPRPRPTPRRFAAYRVDRGRTLYLEARGRPTRTGPMPVEVAPGVTRTLVGVHCKLHGWTEDHEEALPFSTERKAMEFLAQQERIARSQAILFSRNPTPNLSLIQWVSELADQFAEARVFRIT